MVVILTISYIYSVRMRAIDVSRAQVSALDDSERSMQVGVYSETVPD